MLKAKKESKTKIMKIISIYTVKNLVKRTIFLSFFFLLFFSSSNIFSQRVTFQAVEIKDNVQKDIFFKRNIDTTFIKNQTNIILQNEIEKGYILAEIDSIFSDSLNFKVFIKKSEKFYFGIIEFVVNDSFSLDKNIFNPENQFGKDFSFDEKDKIIEKIISYFENNGFPFVQIIPLYFDIDSSNRISQKFNIQTNQSIKFNDLTVKGNAKISKKYLEKFLEIEKSKTYNELSVKQISKRISGTGFLSEIKPSETHFYENKADLYLYLKPKKANTISGIAGFASDQNSKTVLTGNFNLNLLNSFGKAEKISLNWKSPAKSSQILNSNFEIPYIFKSRFGISFFSEIDKVDSSWLNINFLTGINYFFQSNSYIKFYYENKSSKILTSKSFDSTLISNSDTKLFGLEYFSNSTDNIFNPRKGFNIKFAVANGKRNIDIGKNNYINISNSASLYVSIRNNLVFKISNFGQYIFSNFSLFENELLKFGGYGSMRGFNENELFASKFTVMSLEMRYLFEEKSNFFIFFDFGRYEKKSINSSFYDSPISFGSGVNFEAGSGIISVVYAIGKTNYNSLNFSNSKIHIAYVVVF